MLTGSSLFSVLILTFQFFPFIGVLGGCILWHLQRFLQCIKCIIHEVIPSILIFLKCFLLLFIYSHVHTLLGHFFPLLLSLNFCPLRPQFQAGPVLPLSLVLLKKRVKPSKGYILPCSSSSDFNLYLFEINISRQIKNNQVY
jgi:hypothetical protein